MEKKQLGGILMENKAITGEQLKGALSEQGNTKELLGSILIKLFQVDEKDVLKALSEQFKMPLVTFKNKDINWDFIKQFSPSFIMDSRCFPVRRDNDALIVAITNPMDEARVRKAEDKTSGFKLKFALVPEDEMQDVMLKYKEYVRNKIGKLLE